ncbi:Putative conjugal transfer protein [BD1-7 clade bacterium]|uniref:Conjugal transfer protein n=1 Tax=BD1-7 clade bacterium TaxID=2029982 RepID=A0A5S9Q7V0_9GAMM|nr:Putative conjugal transfer protein [BD1-7 clade bacterium]CAA0114025.1 Putative conjugal transfer protein [BD1-7 clade bacterium]
MFGRKTKEAAVTPIATSDALAGIELSNHGSITRDDHISNTGSVFVDKPYVASPVSAGSVEKTAPADMQTHQWRLAIRQQIFATIDPAVAVSLEKERLRQQLIQGVNQIASDNRYLLSEPEQQQLAELLLDEMLGIGAIEPLMHDDTVTDILVNGPKDVFVERHGKLHRAELEFTDEESLKHVARRIASSVGRRIDESNPMVDARLADGSRVNIVIPPLALDGTSISIRKFSRSRLLLDDMAVRGSLSPAMATVLKIASSCRLNILISGGTGAGKTTLLNAMSRSINHDERIVTIEDAAELNLQQPHVVRLETRQRSAEGTGEVSQDLLLRNALRMRPDRIIIGECRGGEAFQMMQAMNTGHDGSMSTLHANSPTDALIRLENMLLSAGTGLPIPAIRRQIASAVHLVVQISRMRDGVRRITSITEINGLEGETILTQEICGFDQHGIRNDGQIDGQYRQRGIVPAFAEQASYYGLDRTLLDALALQEQDHVG